MKYLLKLIAIILVISPFYANAGGDAKFVKFPANYKKTFTKYATENRANQKQVAKFYTNNTNIASYTKDEQAATGSIVIMEIYKPKLNADGKPIPGKNGTFKIDTLAAVAVMENRDNWSDDFPQENRVGNWGFAVYKPDGSAKKNDLNCVQCHTPLKDQDYLFTYEKIVDFIYSH